MIRSQWTCRRPGQDLRPLGQVERRNQLLLFEPLVDAELVADVVALDDEELLVELLLEFALPLEGEVGRGHDQDALAHAPELELLDEQPGHDRLAGPGVVGQEEADAGELQQVVVDRFELMRQRIDAGDGQAEIGIELVGDAEGVSLDAEAKQSTVAVERISASSMVSRRASSALTVTLRKRSEFVPTRPKTQLASPLACTVSTRIGSLKSGPVRIWPTLSGTWLFVILRDHPA